MGYTLHELSEQSISVHSAPQLNKILPIPPILPIQPTQTLDCT